METGNGKTLWIIGGVTMAIIVVVILIYYFYSSANTASKKNTPVVKNANGQTVSAPKNTTSSGSSSSGSSASSALNGIGGFLSSLFNPKGATGSSAPGSSNGVGVGFLIDLMTKGKNPPANPNDTPWNGTTNSVYADGTYYENGIMYFADGSVMGYDDGNGDIYTPGGQYVGNIEANADGVLSGGFVEQNGAYPSDEFLDDSAIYYADGSYIQDGYFYDANGYYVGYVDEFGDIIDQNGDVVGNEEANEDGIVSGGYYEEGTYESPDAETDYDAYEEYDDGTYVEAGIYYDEFGDEIGYMDTDGTLWEYQ